MKKNILLIALLLVVVFSLSGCLFADIKAGKELLLHPAEEIISVEFVTAHRPTDLKRESINKVPYETKSLYVLSDAEVETVIAELNEMDFNWGTPPGSMYDGMQAIKISYQNGDFELLNASARATWTKDRYNGANGWRPDGKQMQALMDKYDPENTGSR